MLLGGSSVMKWISSCLLATFSLFIFSPKASSALRNNSDAKEVASRAQSRDEGAEVQEADDQEPATNKDLIKADGDGVQSESVPAPKKNTARIDRAEAFLAGPDWEFDGFISGAQNQNIKSMFYINDL